MGFVIPFFLFVFWDEHVLNEVMKTQSELAVGYT